MKTEEAIYKHLSTDSTITAIVGTRIYPVLAPQDASYPCLVYQRLGSEPVHAMANDATLREVTMVFASLAKTYSGVKTLQDVLEDSIKDFSGTLGGAGGVTVQRIMLDGISDGYDFEADAFMTIMDYTIWAVEA